MAILFHIIHSAVLTILFVVTLLITTALACNMAPAVINIHARIVVIILTTTIMVLIIHHINKNTIAMATTTIPVTAWLPTLTVTIVPTLTMATVPTLTLAPVGLAVLNASNIQHVIRNVAMV